LEEYNLKAKERFFIYKQLLQEETALGKTLRLVLFLSLYIIGKWVFKFLEEYTFYQEIFLFISNILKLIINYFSILFWGIFFSDIKSNSDFLISINNIPVIILLGGCTGLGAMLRIYFILIFYPITFRKKILLIPISFVTITFGAILHYIFLIPMAYYYPEYHSFNHDYTSRIIFYIIYFLTWLIWERIRSSNCFTSQSS